jgi:hypothetical protein
LPQKTDHRNKKAAKAKGSRQNARWLRKNDHLVQAFWCPRRRVSRRSHVCLPSLPS